MNKNGSKLVNALDLVFVPTSLIRATSIMLNDKEDPLILNFEEKWRTYLGTAMFEAGRIGMYAIIISSYLNS